MTPVSAFAPCRCALTLRRRWTILLFLLLLVGAGGTWLLRTAGQREPTAAPMLADRSDAGRLLPHLRSEVIKVEVSPPAGDGIWGANELLSELEFRLATGHPAASQWLASHAQNPACSESFATAMRLWIADGWQGPALQWAATLPPSTGRVGALDLAARELPDEWLGSMTEIFQRFQDDPRLTEARQHLAQRLASAPAETFLYPNPN
jgi:hypothetical protein